MLIECYATLYKQKNHKRVVISSNNIIQIEETGMDALFQPFGCHCISCVLEKCRNNELYFTFY